MELIFGLYCKFLPLRFGTFTIIHTLVKRRHVDHQTHSGDSLEKTSSKE